MKGTGRKGASKSGRFKEGRGEKTIEGDKGSAGHVARQDTRRQSVDGELPTWMTMIMKQTEIAATVVAEGVEISPSQRRTVMLVECGSLETWRSWKTKKRVTHSARTVQISVMDSEEKNMQARGVCGSQTATMSGGNG